MDGWLRRATPIVLLVLAALAWFGRWLPGHEELARRFGADVVLRFVLGLLCVYTAMLVVERQRLEQAFKSLLGAFKDFHAQRRQPGGAGAGADRAALEAVEILAAALESSDEDVRRTAAAHLKRLTGQDLGPEPGPWRAWLAERAAAEK